MTVLKGNVIYIYLMGFIYFNFSTYFGFMALSVFMT